MSCHSAGWQLASRRAAHAFEGFSRSIDTLKQRHCHSRAKRTATDTNRQAWTSGIVTIANQAGGGNAKSTFLTPVHWERERHMGKHKKKTVRTK